MNQMKVIINQMPVNEEYEEKKNPISSNIYLN
jgi:hypothetical protein